MLNQGQRFLSKNAARKKAEAMRKKGYRAYIKQVLGPKPGIQYATKRSERKLYWWATWE